MLKKKEWNTSNEPQLTYMIAAVATAAGRKSRMIASRTIFSVNLLARKITHTHVKSNHLLCFQRKYKFWHGLSCELTMDFGKGRKFGSGMKKRIDLRQTWRLPSTQTVSDEGDGERGNVQGELEDLQYTISSTVQTSVCGSSYSGNLNEPVGADVISDENLMPSEKHLVSMEIGGSLMRFIKGKRGETQVEIEEELGVKIIFPSSKKEDSLIIEGRSAESVNKASEKIQCIVDKVVNSRSLDYSHFVSLPLAIHPGLVDRLVNFQNTILGISASDKDKNLEINTSGDTSDEEVEEKHPINASKVSVELKTENANPNSKVNVNDQDSTEAPLVAVELNAKNAETADKINVTNIPLVSYSLKESKASASARSSSNLKELGIEKSIFIKPKTFHLTVLMLKLWNKDRVEKAAEVLQNVSPKVMDALENRPVSIRLKGLDCMKGSLAKARVLYAPVEEIGGEGRLLRACQVITDAFIEAGLVMENDLQQKLKLHATVMNARHRKRKTKSRKLDSFDARVIFDQYGSEEWGEYPICEAHLSQRFVFNERGYYHCCASIPFPDDMQVD